MNARVADGNGIDAQVQPRRREAPQGAIRQYIVQAGDQGTPGGAGGHRFIPGISHGTPQPCLNLLGALHQHAGRFGGQVDAHLLHAEDFFKRAFGPADTRRAGHAMDADVDTPDFF